MMRANEAIPEKIPRRSQVLGCRIGRGACPQSRPQVLLRHPTSWETRVGPVKGAHPGDHPPSNHTVDMAAEGTRR